jgi:hypothetical protein
MSDLGWVLLIVALLIAVPLVGYGLRKRDFRRQVDGKRPERKFPENAAVPGKKSENPAAEAEAAVARMKCGQNAMSAK